MERYQVVGYLRLDPEGTVTSYADAQAAVEALQAQLDKTNLENAYANNETRNTLIGGIKDRDVKISTLRQQMEALQRERDQWKEAFERSCDDTAHLKAALNTEREKVENLEHKIQSRGGLALIDDARAKAGLYDQLETQLTQLQALVRALPVAIAVHVDCSIERYIRYCTSEKLNYECAFPSKEYAQAFAKLLEYRATLGENS